MRQQFCAAVDEFSNLGIKRIKRRGGARESLELLELALVYIELHHGRSALRLPILQSIDAALHYELHRGRRKVNY